MIYNTKELLYTGIKPRKSYRQTFKAATDRLENTRLSSPKITAATRTQIGTGTGTGMGTETGTGTGPLRKPTLWTLLKPYLNEYCTTSSIHCFHYFASTKLRCCEKIIWFLIVVTMSACCIVVYCDLAELYYSQLVQTTVADSVHPIFVLPFPSVGICLRNRIDWHRLRYEAPQRFLPPNVDNRTLDTFYNFFESLADIKFYTLQRFSRLFEPSANVNLSLIDGINVLEVLEYLTFPCSQVFGSQCMWRYKVYNCCELFTLDRTEMGFCYTFNSAVSQTAQEKAKNNSFYPYHNSYAGEGSGLEVDVLLNENKMNPEARVVNGLYIMIKKNDEWHADVKFINHNTFTKVALTAQLTETDKRVRSISPVKRKCLFDDETQHFLFKKIPGLGYWRGNCRTRCHQEYVLKYCKCNLNLLFPDHKEDNFTSCKPSDFKCIYERASLFSKETQLFESKYIHDVDNESMICNCLNSCYLLWYHAFYTSFPLEGLNYTKGIKMIHLDIHYQSSTVLKYRSAMRYTLVELLANFGGIIGLFLGASLLSAVELVYFLTIGLYIHLRHHLEKKYRSKPSNMPGRPKLVKISVIEPQEIYKY